MNLRRWISSAVAVVGLVLVGQLVTTSVPKKAISGPNLSITGVAVGNAGGVLSGSYPNPGLLSDAGILSGLAASGALTGTFPGPGVNVGAGASVTGTLPTANQAAQSVTLVGDTTCSGTTSSCTTTTGKINGATVPAGGALTTGNVLQVSGASADTYAAVNLAGGAGFVTGTLPAGNQAAQTCSGDVTGNTGATVVSAISGTTPIAITPNVLQWTKGTAAPTLSQATPTSDVATVPLLIQSQAPFASASSNKISGNVQLNTPAPVAGGATGFTQIQSGGTTVDSLGYCVGSTTQGCFYGIPNTTPTNANYGVLQTSTLTLLNTPSGGSVQLAVNGTGHLVDNATTIGIRLPLGGTNTVPLSWSTTGSAIACGTGGTQTISAAQALTPGLVVTSGTLSSNCVLDFSTNASTGFFVLDMSGVTVGATFGIQFKNGTATSTILSTGVTAGNTLAIVFTHGTNTLAVQY